MKLWLAACLVLFGAGSMLSGQTVWLDEVSLSTIQADWGEPQARRSVEGNPITIGGRTFERGVGTHANSTCMLNLKGKGRRFSAWVGVDDESGGPGTVRFFILGDKKVLWDSGIMKKGEEPKECSVTIGSVKVLGLLVTDADDGIKYDHADWADARLELSDNRPVSELAMRISNPSSPPYILTPLVPNYPRINGPKVFGVRPGHPFLYTVSVSGRKPMTFSAQNLPEGLSLDPLTGRIFGTTRTRGLHRITVSARNPWGRAERELRIVVGDTIALTPPMGWNSWNCWAGAVDDAKIRAAAKAMVDKGFVQHGWTYINIDDTWQGVRGGPYHAIQPNEKFPDMKALSDYVHGLGLKLGIYSTPWITSYAGHCGGSSDHKDGLWQKEESPGQRNRSWKHGKFPFDENDARQWAEWGIDYLKYDWNPNNVEAVERMQNALKSYGRDIVYSLSNSAPFEQASEWAGMANAWRTTGDITDTWASMSGIGFSQDRWRPFAGPGHWNDPDMLVVGQVGWGPELHPTRLTPDEQYTHITLWALLSAPLLLGCDLERLDEFTLNLLFNDEVLEVSQDPLGRQARRIDKGGGREMWVKDLEDGSKAVGLFFPANEKKTPADYFPWNKPSKTEMIVDAGEIGIAGRFRVRDLWQQEDIGIFDRAFTIEVPYHGVAFIRVSIAEH